MPDCQGLESSLVCMIPSGLLSFCQNVRGPSQMERFHPQAFPHMIDHFTFDQKSRHPQISDFVMISDSGRCATDIFRHINEPKLEIPWPIIQPRGLAMICRREEIGRPSSLLGNTQLILRKWTIIADIRCSSMFDRRHQQHA
jgi:hypothetical protein